MTAAGDRIEIHEHFDCSQAELWDAITDGRQLSAWFGGSCAIDPRIGGDVRFDLPDDGVVATGVVRACKPPQEGMTVAHLEHTFVDNTRPELTAVCVWSVVRTDQGCDLYFTMDGAGEAGSSRMSDVWSRIADTPTDTDADADTSSTTDDVALAAFTSAHTVLLVDWVLDEIPATIAATAPLVYGKVGPGADDWALVEPDGDGYRTTRVLRPDHVDLLHLDWTLGFDEFVTVARELGAKTFWYHSARTRPPIPASNRGCWVPAQQSARQRRIIEEAGMTYIDNHYIVEIARRVPATRPR
jgi:hypothetical protein